MRLTGRSQMRYPPRVTSSWLCKYGEGAGFPFQIESLEDGVDNAVHTFYVHKAHHGPGPASHFHEAALDHVGGAQFPPQVPGKGEEGQQFRASRVPGGAPRCRTPVRQRIRKRLKAASAWARLG